MLFRSSGLALMNDGPSRLRTDSGVVSICEGIRKKSERWFCEWLKKVSALTRSIGDAISVQRLLSDAGLVDGFSDRTTTTTRTTYFSPSLHSSHHSC